MKTSLQWELWAVIRTVLTLPPLFRSFTTSSLNGLFIIAPAHWSVKVIWLESSSFSWINTEDRWNLYGYASLQIRFPCYFKHVFIYIVDLNALNACKMSHTTNLIFISSLHSVIVQLMKEVVETMYSICLKLWSTNFCLFPTAWTSINKQVATR